jgi:hypothetical protein
MDEHTIVSILHILLFAPLLFIVALTTWIPPLGIAGLGAFITLYHGYKAYAKAVAGKSYWVNMIHVIAVGPALIAKGAMEKPPRYVNELILMFAFAAVGYHAYYLVVPSE